MEFSPPGLDTPAIDDKDIGPATEGIVRGSCLCEAVKFEITEPFKVIHNCHCSRCRKARAAAHTTNGFVSQNGIRFVEGEQHIAAYKVPDAKFFTHAFCDICGSGMPRVDQERKITVVPMGALDDDPGAKPVDHIFVGSKASWYNVSDSLPCFEQGPG